MIFFVILFLAGGLTVSAQDLYLSCALHPDQHNRQIIGRAGDHDKLWTCVVSNNGPNERVVSEADVVSAMHALGVKAIGATAVRVNFERSRYTGVLYTSSRIFAHANDGAVFATFLGLIKPGPIPMALMGIGDIILPRLPDALRGRAPSGIELETVAPKGDLGVKPGSGAIIYVWSGPYTGLGIVRGWLTELVAPVAKIRETRGLDGPADLTRRKGCSSSSRTPGSQSGAGPTNWSFCIGPQPDTNRATAAVELGLVASVAMDVSGPGLDIPSSGHEARETGSLGVGDVLAVRMRDARAGARPALMLRPCSHILPSDCAGRYCRGWW